MVYYLLAGFFVCSVSGIGFSLGGMTATPGVLCLIAVCALIWSERRDQDRPTVSSTVTRIPLVIAIMTYFGLGLASGIFAAEKMLWFREVIMRSIMVALPFYAFVFGPKNARQIVTILLMYLVVGSLVSVLHIGHISEAKNPPGQVASNVVVIAMAFIIARSRPKLDKYLGIVALVSLVACVVGSNRAALLGAIVATFVLLFAARASWKIQLAGIVACALGAFILLQALPKEKLDYALNANKGSNLERVQTYDRATTMIRENPLICLGWGQEPFYHGLHVGDCASIFYYDWIQMSILGAAAQVSVLGLSILMGISNVRRSAVGSAEKTASLAALGIIVCRFFGAYLDTFWIGRGPTLSAFSAIGMTVFIHLWLNQRRRIRMSKSRPRPEQASRFALASSGMRS